MILRGLKFLRSPVITPASTRGIDVVGDQLGVHAQVAAVHQVGQDRIRNAANPTL